MQNLNKLYSICCNFGKETSIRKFFGNERVNIATALDDNYVLSLGVMLTSLFENTAFRDLLDVYIIEGSLAQSSKQKLLGIGKKYGVPINFIPIDITKFEHLKTGEYWNTAVYYGLMIPVLLSPSIQKVLYLDCDLIVKDDIIDIWKIDISHHFLAAVEDLRIEYLRWDVKDKLGIPQNKKYFNGGVMLINLNLWRQNDISNKILKFIQENPEKISFLDQDGLNKFLYDKWLPLPLKWNQQPYMLEVGVRNSKEWTEAIEKPGIIHFAGESKPLLPSSMHPLKNEYFKYHSLTDPELDILEDSRNFQTGICSDDLKLSPLQTRYSVDKINGMILQDYPGGIVVEKCRDIIIEGWALDFPHNAPASAVSIKFESGQEYRAWYPSSRADVGAYFGNEQLQYCGFIVMVPSDTLALGIHSFMLKIISQNKQEFYQPDERFNFKLIRHGETFKKAY